MPEFKDKDGYSINDEGNKVRTITPTIYVGDGTIEETGEKFEILTTWGQSPVISFEDGSEVIWSWKELINEAIELREQQKEPTSFADEVSH